MTTSNFKAFFAPEPITALQSVGAYRLVVVGFKAMGLYNREGN